jgi:4-amino-4-deoxy-L-arabinose transferase-like glycosyltransferase
MNAVVHEAGDTATVKGDGTESRPRRAAIDRVALIFLAIASVTLGVVLRVEGLGRKSFWGDEVATSRRLASPTLGTLVDDLQRSPFPPLYYLTLRGWVGIWGPNDAALRALPVACGLLALPAVYVVWGRLLGGRATLWSLTLLALNAYHIGYSRDAKMYAAVWLLSAISCGAYLRVLLGSPRVRLWLAAYGLATGCLPLVSYVGIATLAVQILFGLAWFAARRRLDRRLGDLAAVALMASLPALLWFPVAWRAASARTGITWIPPATARSTLTGSYQLFCAFLLGCLPPRSWPERLPWTVPLLLAQVACALGTVGLLAASLARARARWRADAGEGTAAKFPSPAVIAFLTLWFVGPVLGASAFSLGVYSLWGVPRFLTGSAPALILWCGVALGSWPNRRAAVALAMTLLGVNLAVVLIDRTEDTRLPWRTMARTIADVSAAMDLDEAGGIRDLIVTWPEGRLFEADCLDHALRAEVPAWSGLRCFFLPLREARWVGRPFVLVAVSGPHPGDAGSSRREVASSIPGFSCRLASSTRVLDQSFTPLLCPFSTCRAEIWACMPLPVAAPVIGPVGGKSAPFGPINRDGVKYPQQGKKSGKAQGPTPQPK